MFVRSSDGRNIQQYLKDQRNETHFSAKSPQTGPQTRLQGTYVNPRRPGDYQSAPRQGPKTAFRLSLLSARGAASAGWEKGMSAPEGGATVGQRPGRASYPRAYRLTKPSEFKEVFKQPLVSSDQLFKILARPNGKKHSRLGMAVSRHVDRKAAGRNRIKRVIRESFRQWSGGSERPLDIVVLPRSGSASISNSRLRLSLTRHWSRLERQLKGKTNG